jgi:hypothetical protein
MGMDLSVEFGIPGVFFSKEHNQFFKLSRVQSRHGKSKEKHISPSLSKTVWEKGRYIEPLTARIWDAVRAQGDRILNFQQ